VINDFHKQNKLDDICAILRHSGMLSTHLDQFEEASSRMWQLEWKLIRREAATSPAESFTEGPAAAD
jgi:hypothetical protein